MFQKKKALLFLLVTNLLLGMILNASQILPKEISNIIVENVQADKQWWYCRQKYNIDAAIVSMSLSPDGTYLAIGLMDNKARIFDAKTKKLLACFNHNDWVKSVSWSNHGSRLATGSIDGTVRIYDVQEKNLLFSFGHCGYVESVHWSSDGAYLAAGSLDGNVRIFDLNYQRLLTCFDHNNEEICVVRWNDDGTCLATSARSSRGYKARIFDVKTKQLLACFDHDHSIYSIDWSNDGTRLATAAYDSKARIFDVTTKQLLFCSSNQTYYAPFTLLISFSNNLTHLAIQNSGRKKVNISDAKTRQRLAGFKPLEHIYHMSWSNDSCCLAAAGYHTIQIFERYESATLAQLALKYALLNWLLIEKPDKRMIEESYTYDEGIEKILLDVSKKCGLNYYKECVKPWRLFPLKMQEAIARTMHHRIEKYGK